MAESLPKTIPDVQRKMLSAKLPATARAGKNLSTVDDLPARRLFRSAFDQSGLTDQQAIGEMGYEHQAEIAKFLDRLPAFVVRMLSVRALQMGLFLALARELEQDVRVDTVITLRRRA